MHVNTIFHQGKPGSCPLKNKNGVFRGVVDLLDCHPKESRVSRELGSQRFDLRFKVLKDFDLLVLPFQLHILVSAKNFLELVGSVLPLPLLQTAFLDDSRLPELDLAYKLHDRLTELADAGHFQLGGLKDLSGNRNPLREKILILFESCLEERDQVLDSLLDGSRHRKGGLVDFGDLVEGVLCDLDRAFLILFLTFFHILIVVQMQHLRQAAQLGLDFILIFFPFFTYLPQYRIIRNNRALGSFSPFISFILLTANILRIFFWYFKRFGLPLLFQSILMIGIQSAIIYQCSKFQKYHGSGGKAYIRKFWRWSSFYYYFQFLLSLVAVTAIFCAIFLEWENLSQTLGYISAVIQSAVPLPQIINNCKLKSTKGLSYTLIVCWLVGDVLKSVLFLQQNYPIQFVVIGIVQSIQDVILTLQIWAYRGNSIDTGQIELPSLQ